MVVFSHEFTDGNVADGRLVVGLLSIQHHSHTAVSGNLKLRKEGGEERT